MRITKQRQVILETLKTHVDHPGADRIYQEVKEVLPNISLGTVYRNLELLSEEGVIQKLEYGSGQKRFDPNPEGHPHFRCVQCGAVSDLPFQVRDNLEIEDHEWTRERKIIGYSIEIRGICPDCIN